MAKNRLRAVSLVLCLALVLTSVFACTFSVFAASGKVYVRANNGWSSLYCYMWNSDSDKNAAWPGVQMTNEGDGVYSYTPSKSFSQIIFNNGSGGSGNQTDDLSFPGTGQIYDLSGGSWSAYSGGSDTDATQAVTQKATTAVTTTPSGSGTTVYFKNTDNWGSVNCYMWNSDSDRNAAWPGSPMTKLADNIWSYTASKTYANCIFNNGSTQSDDLTAKNGYIYDWSSKSWSIYDTSPIRVTAYSADPAEEIYTGTDVTLSTTAASTASSAVYYRISVAKSGSSATVLKDFDTASSVMWTPTSAGSYTVTFDYRDGAGNENSRTLTLSVASDSGVVSPIIKSVTPYNLNIVPVGSSTTVSVKAGGGITGTNLLFYKYIVIDPNGGKNTPYYTLNNTYSFTPAMAGTYTVDVYVQGSDNTTVNKTYTYTASGNVPVTTAPATQPATQTGETEPAETIPGTGIRGDVDGDGLLSIRDATEVQKYVARFTTSIDISLDLGDLDDDGIISIKDATVIQKLVARVAV